MEGPSHNCKKLPFSMTLSKMDLALSGSRSSVVSALKVRSSGEGGERSYKLPVYI